MYGRRKKMVFLLKKAKIKSCGRELRCTKNSLFYCPVNGGKFIPQKRIK